jgi:hypothetical protein
MAGFGDELAGALLDRTIGQGSQVTEQHFARQNPDDQATHARKPTSAATAAERGWRIRALQQPAGRDYSGFRRGLDLA